MKPTLRNRATRAWMTPGQPNLQFLGMAEFCIFLEQWFHYHVKPSNYYKAIEIGSHTGEGLAMIASTHLFNKIHVIEPFSGDEEFNKLYDWDWSEVRREWQTNTRLFKDFIQLHKGYSYEKVSTIVSSNSLGMYLLIPATSLFPSSLVFCMLSINMPNNRWIPTIEATIIILRHRRRSPPLYI